MPLSTLRDTRILAWQSQWRSSPDQDVKWFREKRSAVPQDANGRDDHLGDGPKEACLRKLADKENMSPRTMVRQDVTMSPDETGKPICCCSHRGQETQTRSITSLALQSGPRPLHGRGTRLGHLQQPR